uniref:Variant surface glycoprotein 476 n=1 Tax=Trypanosoma brucei TaxID=5691 RepID=M4TDB6_9TRYP|nr:variant surface glycoprotein 476 [Trypanosoma brucei]
MLAYTDLAAAVVITLTLASTVVKPAAKGPIAAATWEPLCKLSGQLKESQQAVKSVIGDLARSTTKASGMASRLELYIDQLSTTKEKKTYLPFLYALKDKTADLQAADATAAQTSADYVTHAMYTAGRIDEFGEILLSTGKSSSKTCIGDTGDRGLAKNTAQERFASCMSKPMITTSTITAKTPSQVSSIKATEDDTTTGHHGSTACPLTAAGSADLPFQSGEIWDGESISVAGGLATLGATDTVLKQISLAPAGVEPKDALQAAARYHEMLKTQSEQIGFEKGNVSADSLISSPNFNAYVKVTYNLEDNAVAAKINELYGQQNSEFRKNFWKNIELVKVEEGASTKKKSEELIQIKDPKDLHVASIYYRTKIWQTIDDQVETIKKLQAKSENKNAKIEEATCNSAKDKQEACKKLEHKGCVFKENGAEGKKCTLSEEGKKEASEKEANQETGGKTEEKCSDKKKEGDCTGNCKWEGETCKDSSFFLNKQSALMVSAAFFALLF